LILKLTLFAVSLNNSTPISTRADFAKPVDYNKTISALAGLLLASSASAAQVRYPRAEQLADAIFRVENSRTHPYGVMIPTRNPRRTCLNTINHAWVDFNKQQESKDFLVFLADRYCPKACDPVGNKNWKHNIHAIFKP